MNGAATNVTGTNNNNNVSGSGSDRVEGSPRTQPKITVTGTPESVGKNSSASSSASGIKRAESLRVSGGQSGPSSLNVSAGADASRLKRNPSFTTRKRSTSMRKVKGMEGHGAEDLPPVEVSGFLERKHEQQSGGKRAAIRSWKTYYTGALANCARFHNLILNWS